MTLAGRMMELLGALESLARVIFAAHAVFDLLRLLQLLTLGVFENVSECQNFWREELEEVYRALQQAWPFGHSSADGFQQL